MSRLDRVALVLSLLGVLVSYIVADRIFQRMAHIEDEMAYVWQAQAIARGRLTVPTPPDPKSILVPFVVDYNGQRFGKYPLGWPVTLALGVRLGLRDWINPLLAGLGVWLTYLLGKRMFGEPVGLLAAALTLSSPFFLMNSGSLLSHPFGLFLSAAFALAWLDAFGQPAAPRRWLPVLTAALCLGLLALTRPLTAVAVGLPFGLHGLYLLVRGDADPALRWLVRRRVLALGAIALFLASIHIVWQYAVTGDPFLNPYTLWWKYDQIGFGPGIGRTPAGHNLNQAIINTRYSLNSGKYDLFGWGPYSWIFLPFGLWASRRSLSALLTGSVIFSLVGVYMLYWIGAALFGPRYYYEGLFSLTLLTAAGIAWLAGWPTRPGETRRLFTGWGKLRPLGMTALVALLVAANLLFFTPMRLGGMYNLYEVNRQRLEPFKTAQAQELTPALVVVHPSRWTHYGALLELENPFLDTSFIFAFTRGPEADAQLAADYRQRKVFHYYPDDPYTFYTAPRAGQ